MIRALLIGALLATAAHARDNGQYADVDPAVREWFGSQKVPGTGMSCCTEADGAYAEADTINGRWWARWRIEGALTAWMPVPAEAVLAKANRNGGAVVWWAYRGDELFIRCFVPGALT